MREINKKYTTVLISFSISVWCFFSFTLWGINEKKDGEESNVNETTTKELVNKIGGGNFNSHENCNKENQSNGCSKKFENFCNDLYSDNHHGNVTFDLDGQKALQVTTGQLGNGLTPAFRTYLEAKLKAVNSYPPYFKKYLEKNKYFKELEKVLNEKGEVNLDKLNLIWNMGLNKVILKSKNTKDLNDKEEKYYSISELNSDLLNLTWKDHPSWKKVEEQFKIVQDSFYRYIENNGLLSSEKKQDWKDRIRSIKLVIPNDKIADCGVDEENAYYLRDEHALTVCAGIFTQFSDFTGIIAHEMAHSLGIDSDYLSSTKKSELAGHFLKLREEICSNKSVKKTCPPTFKKSVENWDDLIKKLDKWSPSYKMDFYQCLQKNDHLAEINRDEVKNLAKRLSLLVNDDYANRHLFLQLVKEKIPSKDGRLVKNDMYLNPCKDLSLNPNEMKIEEGVNQLLLFLSSYLCSSHELKDEVRLENAITQSGELMVPIYEHYYLYGGRFSADQNMALMGYSEDISEKLADSIGSNVYALILADKKVSERWPYFLTNSAHYCSSPSFELVYPKEASTERLFSFEPHSIGPQRRLELLSSPIRKILGCEKDFTLKDCSI